MKVLRWFVFGGLGCHNAFEIVVKKVPLRVKPSCRRVCFHCMYILDCRRTCLQGSRGATPHTVRTGQMYTEQWYGRDNSAVHPGSRIGPTGRLLHWRRRRRCALQKVISLVLSKTHTESIGITAYHIKRLCQAGSSIHRAGETFAVEAIDGLFWFQVLEMRKHRVQPIQSRGVKVSPTTFYNSVVLLFHVSTMTVPIWRLMNFMMVLYCVQYTLHFCPSHNSWGFKLPLLNKSHRHPTVMEVRICKLSSFLYTPIRGKRGYSKMKKALQILTSIRMYTPNFRGIYYIYYNIMCRVTLCMLLQ